MEKLPENGENKRQLIRQYRRIMIILNAPLLFLELITEFSSNSSKTINTIYLYLVHKIYRNATQSNSGGRQSLFYFQTVKQTWIKCWI